MEAKRRAKSDPGSKAIPFPARKIRRLNSPFAGSSSKPDNPLPIARDTIAAAVAVGRPLSSAGEIAAAIAHLKSSDDVLAGVIAGSRSPEFSPASSMPPFAALARTILQQQLAAGAAEKIYLRFLAAAGVSVARDLTPVAVLALPPAAFRAVGVSARKAEYLRGLSEKFASKELSDAAIVAMDDAALLSELTSVKGIGEWTVHMLMIFTLHRPDVLPVGDLGVRKGVAMLYGLKAVPQPREMVQLCQHWCPYRSVGAWYMWRLVESKSNKTISAIAPSSELNKVA